MGIQNVLEKQSKGAIAGGKKGKIAVIGFGQELRGDDGVGPLIARRLSEKAAGRSDLLVIDGGPAPENFTGLLRRFEPDLVLLIDAALMGLAPGAARLLDCIDNDGYTPSTHTTPPNLLASYLVYELGCQVALLGIQPAEMTLGVQTLTPCVEQAAQVIVRTLTEMLVSPLEKAV
jgi:hydrogenase maturation protease HycI